MELKKELKKHAAAIHCANTLSLLQRKISNALLFHAYHELPDKAEHEITVKQLCLTIGYHGNNHSAIKESLRGLLTTLVEWNVIDDDSNTEDWTASTMLASVRIKGSLCRYAYSPRLKELLYSPSMYGKINLIIQSRFQSSYGLALYENCVRYRELPYTKWFELDVFRKLMGVPPGKYVIFRDFKKRVIDKSLDEVNRHTDLHIVAELEKSGRKVIKIRFKLIIKAKKNKLQTDNVKNELVVTKQGCKIEEIMVNKFFLSRVKISALLEEYNKDYIATKVNLILNSDMYRNNKIKNITGYFIEALKNDFQPSVPSIRKVTCSDEERAKAKKYIAIQDDYNQYIKEQLVITLKNLPDEVINTIQLTFTQYLKKHNPFLLSKFNKEGLNSAMVSATYRQFIRMNFQAYLPKLLSLEEFISQLNTNHETE